VGCRSRAAGQLAILTHLVAVPSDVDDVAVVEEPVDGRRHHDLVAEDVWACINLCVANLRI
jgi:hypothetical protein